MGRPAASAVSALSDFVAYGRQAMHHVSSPPSKIPYGGFSPVRLQIGSLDATFAPAVSGGRLYAPVVRLDLPTVRLPLCGGWRTSPRTRRSRGPWLTSGLFCPAGSSLTTASSAPLGLSRPFLQYRPGLCLSAKAQRVPNLLRLSFFPCRLPCPAGRMEPTVEALPPVVAFASCPLARHPRSPRRSRFTRGVSFGTAKFALCYGPESRSPDTDTGFYVRAFIP
jgi:hypothetical protein